MVNFFVILLTGIIFQVIGAILGIYNIGIIAAIATATAILAFSLEELKKHLKALIRINQ